MEEALADFLWLLLPPLWQQSSTPWLPLISLQDRHVVSRDKLEDLKGSNITNGGLTSLLLCPVSSFIKQITFILYLLPLPRRICTHHRLSVCLFVCLLATLCKNFWTNLHKIFREGRQWANEQVIKFWWWSGSWIRIWIQRRALADVCTVPMLLVIYYFYYQL